MRRKIFLIIMMVFCVVASAGISRAGDDALWTTVTTPDALIVLDLSGSMAWLPHGSSPQLYTCSTGDCPGNEPYYNTPQYSGVPAKLYVSGNNCGIDGPFTVDAPDTVPSMPTSDLWVEGKSCNINGPFYLTKPSGGLALEKYVYINKSQSCSFNGPFYPTYNKTYYSKSCLVAGYPGWFGYDALPSPLYRDNDGNCTSGPFYRTSGSGHTQPCHQYTKCTAPATGYTETDCTNGPFWKTSGAGHTTFCASGGGSSKPCDRFLPAYTGTTCEAGPFYRSSGAGHTKICRDCTKKCSVSGTTYKWSDTDTCAGPFYSSSNSGARADCSKIAIAKRALFQLMDADASDEITAADVTTLGVRLGLMRYYDAGGEDKDNSSDPWMRGAIRLSWSMTQNDNWTPTPYANIFCNAATCAPTVSSCAASTPSKECVAGYGTKGGTPLANSIKEAAAFLTYHKTIDAAASCRQKAMIVITDGEDTYACDGGGSSADTPQRRAPIYWAKKAADQNFKVYVVGFGGDMPTSLQDTLNWTAYYGKTRNPNDTQTGNTSAVTVGSDPCSNGTDPKDKTLRGYAFMASNPEELVSALASAMSSILAATYSFSTQASVAAARVQEENYIYEASFEPKDSSGILKEPFWTGHLKKYQIGDSGSIITPHCWDAGELLKIASPASRNMFTLKSGSVTPFNTTNITAADLAVADDAARNLVVGFYRGEPAYNLENWKLGDLFHTNPAIVKTPLQFFYDPRECNTASHNTFVSSHVRTAANGLQIILAGANDGQLHAFRTGSGTDCTSGGEEIWSFIPPNLLQKLAPIAHNSHADRPSLAVHDFFVDGPIQVFDAWLGSGTGVSKSANDWKTLAVFGEGQGSGSYLWSSSSTCYSTSPAAFSDTYSNTHPYYCGLHALDVTDTSNAGPVYKWHLNPTAGQAPYLGQAWSKIQTGRVKIGNDEKFVGFIGGGYSAAACLAPDGTSYSCTAAAADGSAPYRAGKGFFVVDLNNGSIIWSYTHASNGSMDFSAAASPLPVDTDSDGFIDTVYMGDLGGNMWRFRLCPKDPNCSTCGLASYTASPCTSCTTSDWTGSLLYTSNNAERGSGLPIPANTHKQIFTAPTAGYDDNGNLWIFFGTGENNDPTYRPTDAELAADPGGMTKNRLYAVKEDLGETPFTDTYTLNDLQNITSSTYSDAPNKHGWYVNLATNPVTRSDGTTISNPKGEKMISDPTLFGGYVFYATYVPDQGSASACGQAGDAFLYKLNYMTGARTTSHMGKGIGSSVLVSYRPGFTAADIYATTSGGAGTGALTQTMGEAPKAANMTNILYWKDRRLE